MSDGPALGGGRGGSKKHLNIGPPPSHLTMSTFDWDGQRDRYWRRLDWQALVDLSDNADAKVHRLRLLQKPEAAEVEVKKIRKKASTRAPRSSTPRVKAPPKHNSIHMTADQIREACRLYTEEQLTVGQIAKATGFSDASISRQLKKAGIYTPGRDQDRNRGGRGAAISEEDLPKLVEQYLSGKTTNELMGIWGIKAKETIIRALRRADVYDPNRDKGGWRQKRLDVCRKGLHSMQQYGRPVNAANPEGPKYCYACSRIRRESDPATADMFDTVDNPTKS